jgi:hypothetical protein
VWKTWTENYGDSKIEVKKTFMNALIAMKKGTMDQKNDDNNNNNNININNFNTTNNTLI